jgi:hypothetical protein
MLVFRQFDGRAAPIISCDQCSQMIEDGEFGMVYFQSGDFERGDARAYFAHKGCADDFELARGGGREWSWIELSTLPVRLLHNLRLSYDDTSQLVEDMQKFS